jgi:succinoglycan biosynthesis transport protein ExoP
MLPQDTANVRSSAHSQGETERPTTAYLRPMFGLESLRRHKHLLGLGCALGLSLGLLYAALTPTTYTTSIGLLVYNRQLVTGPDSVILPGSVDVPLLQNQIEILRSRTVLAKVISALNLTNDPEYCCAGPGILQSVKELISSRSIQLVDDKTRRFVVTLEALRRRLKMRRLGMSHIVQVRLAASEPEKAMRIANEVAHAYVQERTRLISEAAALRELYQGLGPSADVTANAELPVRPDGPTGLALVLGAALLGLAGAAVVAILLDAFNNTIRNPEQLEHFLGLQCLGFVPYGDSECTALGKREAARRGGSKRQGDTGTMPSALRRALVAVGQLGSREFVSLGITSTVSGEGTTRIATHLARLMALSGKRVLLIDHSTECTSLLRGRVLGPARSAAQDSHPALENGASDAGGGLHVLSLTANASSASGLTPLDEIVRAARQAYEVVIVDFPCLASGPDVRAAAHLLDGFLLVIKWGATDCELARQAIQSAGEAQAKFVGAVFNMADQHSIDRYGDKLSTTTEVSMPSPPETQIGAVAVAANEAGYGKA